MKAACHFLARFVLAIGALVALLVGAGNDLMPATPAAADPDGDTFTTRVSVDSSGAQGNDLSWTSAISADGRYVAFRSDASNLVPGDTNGGDDIFVHDRQTGITERVSVSSVGEQGNDLSWSPAISANGRYVAFASYASNLVPGDTNDCEPWYASCSDAFVHDRQTGVTERVSVSTAGAQGDDDSGGGDISADGRYVAFSSYASNLVPDDTNSHTDTFVHDRQTGVTERVSVSTAGAQGDGSSPGGDISADGRYVAFASYASNLVPDDTNGEEDIFVHDRQTGITERVSVSSAGEQGDSYSGWPSISADGRYVAFESYASNLVPGDTNICQGEGPPSQTCPDIFLHDRQTGITQRVNVDSAGEQANGWSSNSSISADGRYVAFDSSAPNLVTDDTNGTRDVFVVIPSPAVFDPTNPWSRPEYPTSGTDDPVNLASGDLTHSHTDILIPGRGIPLEFTRYYHSGSNIERSLGHGWTHSYDMYLEIEPLAVTVFYPQGHATTFTLSDGELVPPQGVFDTLVDNGDGTYTLTTKEQVKYLFLSDGKLDTISDRNDNTTRLYYDVNGRLDYVTDASQLRQLTFSYDDPVYLDYITTVTEALGPGRTIDFTYDPLTGDLTDVQDVEGGTTSYEYDDHRMTSLTDSNLHRAVQNCYDEAGRVAKQFTAPPAIQDCANPGPGVETTVIEYETPVKGQTTVTDPRGAKTIHTFDTSFRTAQVESFDFDGVTPLGTVQYEYDADNNVTCVTDQRNNKSAYSYDDRGNVTQIIDALNTDENCELIGDDTWDFTYTDLNDLESETDPLHRTNYLYDDKGNLTRVVQRTGSREIDSDFDGYSNGNDGEGSIGTDPLDDCTDDPEDDDAWPPDFDMNTVINNGDLFNVLPPYFGRSCTNYLNWYVEDYPRRDLFPDCVINLTDVLKVLPPTFGSNCTRPIVGTIGALTCFERDTAGQVTAVVESTNLTLPSSPTGACTGNKTLFEYDAYGNQTGVIDPRFSAQPTPPKTVLTYDLGGRMETMTNELNHTTHYTYDGQNNVLSVSDHLTNTTSNTYDAKGNLQTVTDANRQPVGAGPETGVDECGDKGTGDGENDDWPDDEIADDGCPSAIYVYDDADRLVEVIDALGNSTVYDYDDNGNRTSVINARGKPTTYVYDALNRLETVTDPLDRDTTYSYDAAGNVDQRTDARGLVTDYTYDALNRLTDIDYVGSSDFVDYTYDAVGNRKTMNGPTGLTTYDYDDLERPITVTTTGSGSVRYWYDNVGNRSRITYPDNKSVTYSYDKAGNLKTVTDWLSKQTVYDYDDAGNLTDTDLPNGVDTDYTYDDAGRLESVLNVGPGPTTISSFDYTLDAVGNRTEMVDLVGTHSYEYDALYRLTEVKYPDEETDTYTYDAVGNRLTKDTDDYTYDDADQLTNLEGMPFGYDENGNQTSRGTQPYVDDFAYDHENRLVGADINYLAFGYSYNGDGLRMRQQVFGQPTTNYTWDVAAGLPVVLQDGDNTYVYGLDLISATDGGGVQTYFLYDGLGSTSDLTDGSGNVVDGYTYDVFGALRSGSPGATDFLFTGEQRDADSGLYYLRARYYDPEIGRFLSRDPARGGHPYGYVANNPVRYVDPSGLCHIETGLWDYLCGYWAHNREGEDENKEGGSRGDSAIFFGVNRGNLTRCPGNIEHRVKEDNWGGPRDQVLCDKKTGKVYIQRWYQTRQGNWKQGALEEAGYLGDYQTSLSDETSPGGDGGPAPVIVPPLPGRAPAPSRGGGGGGVFGDPFPWWWFDTPY